MTRTIGQLTYSMDDAALDALGAVPQSIADVYGDRIDAATVVLRAHADMPLIRPGLRSRARWSESHRRIVLSTPFDEYDVQATLGHESAHVLDDDWLTRPQRRAILTYLTPMPDGWRDDVIDGEGAYENLPSECWASWGAAAMLGCGVAFPKLYGRKILRTDWPKVAALALGDQAADDPLTELQQQLDGALAELSALREDAIAGAVDVGQLAIGLADLVADAKAIDAILREAAAA